ncbi:hypothetical protein AB0I68_33495 [Streptomyces sp. NPDC050448]|uniref:hypothetical protein n=1 Tax=Streptomyces sp. NPDC050448 TaxID=3155404 RepID=UPI00342320FA
MADGPVFALALDEPTAGKHHIDYDEETRPARVPPSPGGRPAPEPLPGRADDAGARPTG